MRQAKCYERAQDMMPAIRVGGEYVIYGNGIDGVYAIYKKSYSTAADTSYLLDNRGERPTCTCPDFEKHKDFCKHSIALELYLQELALEQQTALFTEDYDLLQAAMMDADATDSDLRGNYGIAY